MTDITELAQLRAELSNPAIGSKDHLRKLALSLVEALEKAQQADDELCKLLPPGVEYMDPPDGGDVEPIEQVRRMVADYRQRIAELEESNAQVIQSRDHYKRMTEEGLKQLAESRTVKLPDDEDGQAYGFGKWANGKLPATAGTMTIAYCEDAWRAAFEVFSSTAGIKVEAE
ncbi:MULTISPECIES: hypothetical protein [Klebsiella]|uniref:hypothetical protein n=1 Tax=Klebsiella TaxID=570 RepID=UPI00187D32DA|nr:hypothetical protein [Klebsiella oxytoca]HED3230641.1 hypothetical protein [Klebsiella oxytoca]HED3471812.1 hypothetical protein [Klebsiella oxytoca]